MGAKLSSQTCSMRQLVKIIHNSQYTVIHKPLYVALSATRGYLQIYFSSRRGYEFEIYAKQVALSGREIPM